MRVPSLRVFYLIKWIDTLRLASFADGQLTDAIRHLANNSDGTVDKRVQKKTLAVLLSWHEQFKGDPSMIMVANLYLQCKREKPRTVDPVDTLGAEEAKRRAEKEEAKRRAKLEKEQAKERARKEEEERRKQRNRPRRQPFNFEAVSVHLTYTLG